MKRRGGCSSAIPGVEFKEMPRNRRDAYCCGAGGMIRYDFGEMANLAGADRIAEAESTGAEVLTSACPACVMQLQGSRPAGQEPAQGHGYHRTGGAADPAVASVRKARVKRTIFYYPSLGCGAHMRQAQGWEMPDHFGDPRAEHLAVRQAVRGVRLGVDGRGRDLGRDALALVQKVIVNDASRMPVGRVLYTTMCRPDGAIMSDVTIYRLDEERYWCMTAWGSNQANRRPEYEWFVEQAHGLDVCVTDVSSGVALLAVQGPAAGAVVASLTPIDLATLPYMWFAPGTVAGIPSALISRSGYTGELGYELIVPAEHGCELWDALEAAGRPHGLRHAGLDVAFSLRMEKGYIARFDFMDDVTPDEAGIGWTVKLDKGDFIGRGALPAPARGGRHPPVGVGSRERRSRPGLRRPHLSGRTPGRQNHQQRFRPCRWPAPWPGAPAGSSGRARHRTDRAGRRRAGRGRSGAPAILRPGRVAAAQLVRTDRTSLS